jgi:nitroreductase
MELRTTRPMGRRGPADEAGRGAPRAPLAAWQISEFDFPYHGTARDKLRFLLRYALLAPSPYNTQPWLFRIEGDRLELLSDSRRLLPLADPRQRQHFMSCGGLLAALRIAARHFGYDLNAQAPTSPDAVAAVTLVPGADRIAGERSLFLTLPKRRRHVAGFDPGVPSAPLLDSLAVRAQDAGAELRYAFAPDGKDMLRAIAMQAQARRLADGAFRAELEQWLRPAGGSRLDGMPHEPGPGTGPALGAPEWADPAELSTWARRFGSLAQARVANCPVLAVLATPCDTQQDWLAAGALVLQLELLARASGVWLVEFPDAIELPECRARVAQTANAAGHPQVLLGLGYGAEVPPLPRRPLEDVLLPDQSPVFPMH